MNFRIADTFSDSLGRLTNEEQKAVKNAAFDLQLDPSNPGFQFHKLDRAKDPNFWSVRVSKDIRIIVHRTKFSLLLCYVDHHDQAYRWAERRKLETHPKTGAAQIVEIRETVKEVVVPVYVEEEQAPPPKPPLFTNISEDELLEYGVPTEWLDDVKQANEDSLLELADHLPSEAAEALLELAVGGTPEVAAVVPENIDPFEHPDAQRRFRVMTDVDELERALDYPWEKWAIFLHPAQQDQVEKDYTGPARVSGSAGTGKTIVALHRAVHLARKDTEGRVLLTTFSDPLARVLTQKLHRLISNQPRLAERIDVHSMESVGRRLYELHFGSPTIADRKLIADLISHATKNLEHTRFTQHFLMAEWEQVVDAWQISSWEDYRDVARVGRKTRLPENRRRELWDIFESVRAELNDGKLITIAEMFSAIAEKLNKAKHPPYEYVIVDEAQDISVAQLRFLAVIGDDRPNSLFFAGDLGQRIFQQPFSWMSLGVDVRGRSRTLKINYRTSHQIRMQADRLLAPEIADVDGITEERRGTISVFNGPAPEIVAAKSSDHEAQLVGEWLTARQLEGVEANEIGVFVRSVEEIERAKSAADKAGFASKVLDDSVKIEKGQVSISTMHLAKGLEFKAVVVMACDDEVLPSQDRIENVADENELEEVYNTERHLLYVACTRARDNLMVSGVDPVSEFLSDLISQDF